MQAFAVPFLLFVGSLLALQAAANVQLSTAVGSPLGASALQLGLGAVALLVLAAAAGSLGAFGLLDDSEPWHLAGGLGSALYITAGIVLFPRLGALVSVGLFFAGQMLASLALDVTGSLGVDREALEPSTLAGAAGVVAGTAMIVRAQAGDAIARTIRERPALLVLGIMAGAALPVQGAVNAQLRADLDAPLTAAAWSFIVAAAAMLAVLVVVLARAWTPPPSVPALDQVPWWGWLGGLCGATYVTSVFLLIPEIGVAPTVALTVAGQQIASALVDRHGWLRLPRRPITPVRLAGVATLLTGVALVQLA